MYSYEWVETSPKSADILKAVNTGSAVFMQEALNIWQAHRGSKNSSLCIESFKLWFH